MPLNVANPLQGSNSEIKVTHLAFLGKGGSVLPVKDLVQLVLATARMGQNVVEAAFVRLEQLAGVLAAVAVAFYGSKVGCITLMLAGRNGARGRIRSPSA